jgi:hypothetical protein
MLSATILNDLLATCSLPSEVNRSFNSAYYERMKPINEQIWYGFRLILKD